MGSVLFDIDCEDLWQISRQQAHQADPEDASDRIAVCPSAIGEGYKRDIELRSGIDLTFHQYQLKDDLVINRLPPGENSYLEWMFILSSGFQLQNGVEMNQSQHLLAGLVSPGGTVKGLAHRPTVQVDIHLEPERLKTLIGDQPDVLPSELQRMLVRDEALPFSPVRKITPAMHLALQQMLNCPYHGAIKQMYLESKSIEVLSLWFDQVRRLDQVSSSNSPTQRSTTPQITEVERIYQAKNILVGQMDDPPSLLALARQVGLNDCTLKRGFKQVFGTTVFSYLHQCRMEQARSLLLEHRWSVTEVAHKVGYKNLCAFSTAFRKTFGVSPKAMQP
ncbi:transcriptional regulator, AraC family [Leptolyngbya sp. NIES-3755]|nr:transcriptional regulator, AraC family [Leptolyngbya sp. NIES-3755]